MKEYICKNCCKNKGYVNWAWYRSDKTKTTCYKCNEPLIETNLSRKEIRIINTISDDIDFMKAMMDLKDKDIIEFNLKLSQFENQVKQNERLKANSQQTEQKSDVNVPKCPKCGSTHIQIVPRKFSILTGFATNKTDRICVNCKYKW